MPTIWNIGNTSGYNNKKISSKLTFEEGETFKGKIVGKGNGNEDGSVVIRLTDGWQFPAELLEDSNLGGQQLLNFRVEGFEDGKVKLKIINDLSTSEENVADDIIKDFIQKQGMSEKDFDILKAMVKFNLPLTKGNIEFVKTVFNFSQKANTANGVDEFINKYIASKGIEPQSQEAAAIKDTLTEFFNTFKTMSQDDILLFLENGIDINKENIESYNKLFKSDSTLKEYFDNVYKDFSELNISKDESIETIVSKTAINEEIEPKAAETNNQNTQGIKYSQAQNAGLKIYDNSTSSKSRVSLLNLLRTVTGNENNLTKDTVKNILLENKNIFKGLELSDVFNKLDNMTEDEVKNIFKEYAQSSGLTKESMNEALRQLVGKDIKLNNNEAAKLKEVLDFKESDFKGVKDTVEQQNIKEQVSKDNKNTIFKNDAVAKENAELSKDVSQKEVKNLSKGILQSGEKLTSTNLVKRDINGKMENIKDVIKQILSSSEQLKDRSLEGRVVDFIRNNINDFKLLNTLSNEYYYMDIPINKNSNEYPCKLIVKDERRGNKKIDSSNVKMVVAVKTVNMDTVDAYLTVSGQNLNVDIKCESKFKKLLASGTEQLAAKLHGLGYFVSIDVSEKVNEVSLTSCREFFDDGNTITLDTKV